ncbi:hypothetical protein SAMN02745164_01859 [Marinitoga hydrogenitolerans DSM 16785]|uniref:Uncharacterized protein n=1 Tax=Marinitoga hydrogenitolerans (strain DSM 16785 / JCM 12826 / AT1271) TaxID=1122195 RepID=A0A1M4Z7A5_MARH1|nr:hypothetical protein [Marinitoga hydrogenitolerans]SHF13667.1 hypothetical protein SAMN02745164_01859 [Marinitoga hydrogenitolerans DSM 16785]
MKGKFIILTMIIFSMMIFAETIGEFYASKFDVDKMINSEKVNIKIFGYIKKYFETGYSGYLRSANQLRVKYDNSLNIEEKKIFDIMSSLTPQTTIEPIKKLKEIEMKYPNSLIIKILLLEFNYKQWLITGDPKLAKEILNEFQYIEKIMGDTPLTVFYKANFLYKSNLYGDKETSYKIIKDGVLKFPDNKKIVESFLTISSQMEKDKEDEQIFDEISKSYVKNPEVKENILLLISKHFFEINDKNFAKQIIIDKIMPNTRNSKILFLSYELLGDYTDTNVQKMNYYKKALNYNSENARVLSKWALAMLEVDREKYKSLARIALNKAITINPNMSEDAMKALRDLRNEIKIEVLINYILPITLFVGGSISIMVYYEKRKKKKEKYMLLDSNNDEDGEKDE